MSCVIDLYQWRHASPSLSHPAGVALPVGGPGDAELFVPQLRSAIANGRYCADLIDAHPQAVSAGTRALVIGSGLGILSTLIAKIPGIARVIVIEPHIAVADYITQVHRANGVPTVETLNGIPVEGGRGRVPFFVRHDVRASSLVPDDGPWRQVMLVPGIDLGVILAEERIGLVVAEHGPGVVPILARADLTFVDRMVLGNAYAGSSFREKEAAVAALEMVGFEAERAGGAIGFGRANSACGELERRASSI